MADESELPELVAAIKDMAGVIDAMHTAEEITVFIEKEADYEAVADVAGDVEINFVPYIRFSGDNFVSFRGNDEWVEIYDRFGEFQNPGVAKMLQDRAKLDGEPTLNAIIDNTRGILFHNVKDKAKFDEFSRR